MYVERLKNTVLKFECAVTSVTSKMLLLAVVLAPTSSHAQDINQLITSALVTDPSIKVQVALERAAEARVKTAQWQYYPTPSITLQSAISGFDDKASERIIKLSLQQPLWDGGALDAGLDQAKANRVLQSSNIHSKQLDVAQNVIQAYGKWWVERQKHLSWNQGVEIHERFVEQVGRRVATGVSAKIDLELAKGRLSATYAERDVALAQEQVAFDELKMLTSIDGITLPDAAQLPNEDLSFISFDTLLQGALNNSQKIHQARAKVAQSLAEHNAQKATIWPKVYLQAERNIGDFTNASTAPETKVFVGFTNHLEQACLFKAKARPVQLRIQRRCLR